MYCCLLWFLLSSIAVTHIKQRFVNCHIMLYTLFSLSFALHHTHSPFLPQAILWKLVFKTIFSNQYCPCSMTFSDIRVCVCASCVSLCFVRKHTLLILYFYAVEMIMYKYKFMGCMLFFFFKVVKRFEVLKVLYKFPTKVLYNRYLSTVLCQPSMTLAQL